MTGLLKSHFLSLAAKLKDKNEIDLDDEGESDTDDAEIHHDDDVNYSAHLLVLGIDCVNLSSLRGSSGYAGLVPTTTTIGESSRTR